jgi:hypothetical protein
MKYLYNVQVQKADGTPLVLGIIAADSGTGTVVPAAVNAINYAFTQAGSGAVLIACNRAGQVDHDTTA